jgi:hypothetical protein
LGQISSTTIVQRNNEKFVGERIRFLHINLVGDSLPKVEPILYRDCLVHLSFKNIFLALENVCRSESHYNLTTITAERTVTRDIFIGQWRTLNLRITPFNLPEPREIILERCAENDGAFQDKALDLWTIAGIRGFIASW